MKKSILTLAAAMMAAAANGTDMYDAGLRFTPAKARKKSPAEQKKCKSCKHIRKEYNPCRCAIIGYTNPMNCACEHYEKRKK